jgi:Na+-transporting NADH:ubiquinone oxidoreductase subunit C
MTAEKKPFTESRIYPILFMIVVTIFFGTLLALFYHSTRDRIQAHSELRFKQALLSLFDYTPENVEEFYDEHVMELQKSGVVYYSITAEGEFQGYCFPISGSGLWGTINALIAVKPDFQTLIGLEITDQNETPGLGGRIAERSFLQQFTGKNLKQNGELIRYRLVPENEETTDVEINQITGATSSSNAVVDILYRNLQKIQTTIGDEL